MNKKYLSEIMQDKVLDKNTLIVSPTGSGKTHYIINELCKYKKVLYLCDNSNLEEQVCLEDNTRGVKKTKLKKRFSKTNITVMTYKYFGAKTKYDVDDEYISSFDLVIADEVHNLVDYQTFNNDADLSHAIRTLMQKYDKTPILMFTATPYYLDELAKKNEGIDRYFTTIDLSRNREIMRYINKQQRYINHQSQMKFILEEHKQLFLKSNMKCLIYTNKIDDMKFVENMCDDIGLRPICIWSENNKVHNMNDKQGEVRKHLIEQGELINPYNVLIINRATETGVNIYDKDENIQLVIVNTTNITQQIQARGRIRHNVGLLVIRTKENEKVNAVTFKDELLGKLLLKSDLENIIKDYNLKDDRGRYITVNKLNKFLANSTYEISKPRKILNGKKNTYYVITSGQKMDVH